MEWVHGKPHIFINKLLEHSSEDAIRVLQGLRPLFDLVSFTKASLGHSARSGALVQLAIGQSARQLDDIAKLRAKTASQCERFRKELDASIEAMEKQAREAVECFKAERSIE